MYRELLKALLSEGIDLGSLMPGMVPDETNDFAQYLSEQSLRNHQQALTGKRLVELEQMNRQKDEVIMQLKGYIYDLMNQNKMFRAELSRVGNGLQKELEQQKEIVKALKQKNEEISNENYELIRQNSYLKYEAQKVGFLEAVVEEQKQQIELIKYGSKAQDPEAKEKVESVEPIDMDQLRSFIQTLGQNILSEVAAKYGEVDKSAINNAAKKAKDGKDALSEAFKKHAAESDLLKNMSTKARETENALSKAMKKQDGCGNVSINDAAVKLKEKMDASTINITKQSILINYLDHQLPALKIKERIDKGEQIYILEEGDCSIIDNFIMYVTDIEPSVKTSIMCSTGAKNVLAIMSK